MRKFFVVSRQLLAVGCMLIANAAIAQSGYYTRYFGDEALQQKADAWTASEVWRNGFNAAMPHESVNRIDFYQQYEKNPEQWKALFKWLAELPLVGPAVIIRSEWFPICVQWLCQCLRKGL